MQKGRQDAIFRALLRNSNRTPHLLDLGCVGHMISRNVRADRPRTAGPQPLTAAGRANREPLGAGGLTSAVGAGRAPPSAEGGAPATIALAAEASAAAGARAVGALAAAAAGDATAVGLTAAAVADDRAPLAVCGVGRGEEEEVRQRCFLHLFACRRSFLNEASLRQDRAEAARALQDSDASHRPEQDQAEGAAAPAVR